jgi:DNA polymerase III delta prime subunit
MKNIIEDKNIPLTHFYIVESELKEGSTKILSLLEKRGVSVVRNPDFFVLDYETLKVEDLEFIKSIVLKKTLENETYFVISFISIAREAQHALLKTFEDPRENIHFFVIVKNTNILIDTIKSRAQTIKLETEEKENIDIEIFFKKSKSERLKYIESIIKKHEDADSSAPLRDEAIDLLNSIEKNIHQKNEVNKHVKLLENMLHLKADLNNRGASVKMILEYVALAL